MKGFWYQYWNTWRLVDELGIDNPFTEWSKSSFYTPQGLLTEGPVFQDAPRLPTPIGQAVQTFPLFDFRQLPLQDLVTMLPLFGAILDYDKDEETYQKYDKMSARELFRSFGVTDNLYRTFLEPLLLVGLFAPPEELSAAAVLGTLWFYAGAHQQDFDIRWCKGSVSELIFQPLVNSIKDKGGKILGGHFVTEIAGESGRVQSVTCKVKDGSEKVFQADAVVFAVGIKAMQKIVPPSPILAQHQSFRNIMNLKGIDCIATRLWFDRIVQVKNPANVLSQFDQDVGGTFFILNDLQDEYRDSEGTVVAADFYHANSLLPLSDADILAKVQRNMAKCVPEFADAKLEHGAVLRVPQAVTHFSPGSNRWMPTQETPIPNAFMSGDWVKQVPHGANGLSQERALVTGYRAANMVIEELGVGVPKEILQVEEDEDHVKLARRLTKDLTEVLPFPVSLVG
mmetsp:Transcript_13605/g.49465  ORF Transcript_13605/g.49465 Transcript_13605/m.49465 type:complete len:454 (-) Transcript_13605:248-1609(-)